MKPYESNLKITDELERRVAQQQLDDLSPSVAFMIIVQLAVASIFIVSTAIVLH